MPDYTALGLRETMSSSDASLLAVYSQAAGSGIQLKRIAVKQISAGARGDVAWTDNPVRWKIRRFTSAPTGGTAVTPAPMDNHDQAANTLSMRGATGGLASPTELWIKQSPLRIPFDWVCLQPGKEIRTPATAGNGVDITMMHDTWAGDADGTILFEE